jgi:tripartite-type tricarboxylate transporter receptor subunit TctC
MDTVRRRMLQAVAGAGACALPWARGVAAPLFDKQVSVVVGYPAGTADNSARKLAEKLRGIYASTLIVENKPGARGVPAANAVVSVPADGSVLYVAPNALCTLWPHVYRDLPYNPATDFQPISTIGINELALAVGPNSPITDLRNT